MSENIETGEENVLLGQIAKLDEHYMNIVSGVVTLDEGKCDKNLRYAQAVFRKIEAGLEDDIKVFLCNYVNLMEVATLFVEATLLLEDELLNLSLEKFDAVKQVCADANETYSRWSDETEKLFNQQGAVSIHRFLFTYFENTTLVIREVAKKSLDMSEGRYVNQVEMFREAAAGLRKEDYLEYFTENEVNNEAVSSVINMLTNKADSFERKAERLVEKMKKIEFMPPIDKKVFIVHGHNEAALTELKELLINEFDITPVVLWEEADDGMTVIEKFERYGRLCAFAFVLVTPDDWVTVKDSTYFQARPNVLFELGWFSGRYGRNKVRVLIQKKTPLPSDLGGLITQEFDEKISEISGKIKADLINAGILEKVSDIQQIT